jgi:hypothetical protein
MLIVTVEVTNKVTGKSSVAMASTIGEAKHKAIQKAGHAGWLNFLKEDHTRDLHAENRGFKVDIMV